MRRRPEYDRKLIGRNLRRLREAKGLSVDEVRNYLCLGSVQAIYKYEEGKSYPPADNMLALMELYEAELRDVIRDDPFRIRAYMEGEEDGCALCMAPDLTAGIVEAALFHVDRMRRGDRLERYHKLYRNDKSMAAG